MSPSPGTTPNTIDVDRMFGFHQYEYESVHRLTPKHSEIFGSSSVNDNLYSVPFLNLTQGDLQYGSAYFTESFKRILFCCTVDKT